MMPKEGKVKQTRKRIPRTCAQCRKRKQKCDSLKPCAVCKLRGEGDLCDYEGAQPTRILDDEDIASTPISAAELQRLRSQLDGLETLVQQVVYKNGSGRSTSSNDGDGGSVIDLEEHNVAATLDKMMTTRTLIPGIGQEPPIVERVRSHCKEAAMTRPEWSEGFFGQSGVTSVLGSSYSQTPAELERLLPTYPQAMFLLDVYMNEFEWYHSCFLRSRFQRECEALYASMNRGVALGDEEKDLRWISMATLFAIGRSAVVKVNDSDALARELPISQSEVWLSASISCLNQANFEGRPRVETIVCLIILLEAMWFDGPIGGLGDLGLLFELKCKAMNLGFDLGLHRDPSHRDPSRIAISGSSANSGPMDPELCHHRRMLWWALLSLDELYSGPAGRTSSLISLDAVDVYLPALSATAGEADAHQGCEPGCQVSTPVTGVKPRLLLGFVGHEISRLPMRRTPPTTLKDLSKAHRDLSSLEAHLPVSHKLFEVGHKIDRTRLPTCARARRDAFYFYQRFYYLALKLHRPLHTVKKDEGLPFAPAHHRYMTIHNALLLLDLRKVTGASPNFVLGGILCLSAGISLALDLLFDPNVEEANLIRHELDALSTFLCVSSTPVIRRGLCVLSCLLQTLNTPAPVSTSWFSSDTGRLSATSWSQGPFHQPPEGNVSSNPYDPSVASQALPVFQPMHEGLVPILPPAGPGPSGWNNFRTPMGHFPAAVSTSPTAGPSSGLPTYGHQQYMSPPTAHMAPEGLMGMPPQAQMRQPYQSWSNRE